MNKSSLIQIIIGAVLVIGAALTGYYIKGRFDTQDAVIASLQAGMEPVSIFVDSSQTIVITDSLAAATIDNLNASLNNKLDSLKSIISANNTKADSIINDLRITVDSLIDISCYKKVGFDTTLRLGYWEYLITGQFDCGLNGIYLDFKPIPESYAGLTFKQHNMGLGLGGAHIRGNAYLAGHIRINSINIMPLYDFKKNWGIIMTYTRYFRLF